MRKSEVLKQLEAELKRVYHNATLHGKLTTASDFEEDLVQREIQSQIEMAFEELPEACPLIFELRLGEVYQYGRGGRTVAPEALINRRGFGWGVKSLNDLLDGSENLTYLKQLLKALKQFNDHVQGFCSSVTDSSIEFVREEYSEELEENKNKKRQHYSGVRYV